jgi:hypothetical protein
MRATSLRMPAISPRCDPTCNDSQRRLALAVGLASGICVATALGSVRVSWTLEMHVVTGARDRSPAGMDGRAQMFAGLKGRVLLTRVFIVHIAFVHYVVVVECVCGVHNRK